MNELSSILIIEDEKPNAERLERLLKQLRPSVKILEVLDSVADTALWFNNTGALPGVVMMDIRLSDGLSFEIFDKVSISCPVIFTTAYDEYAVRAFKYNSIDYLLKPVDEDELSNALRKVELANIQKVSQESIQGLLNYFQPKEFRSRFLLPYRDGYKTVLVEEVCYFYSQQKVTLAKLKSGGTEVVPQTMEELEQQLNPKLFFRANRQFIVHIDAIKQIHNHFNGKLKIELKNSDETEVIVSREKAQLLKNWLDY